jgi:hypothetical protein
MDALTPKKITDGFAGYEDRTEGSDQQQTTNVIHGSVIKFTNEASWVTRDGEELSPDLELVPIDVIRVAQKWLDRAPVETIVLEPGQKFPDLEELNNQTPRSEWSNGPDGNPRGPWQAQQILYLLNLTTMERFSFPTGTIGGGRAIRDLVDKIKLMRKYRWPQVYPVVALSDVFMNTNFGGRQRPHFLIKHWIDLSGGGEKALPAPQPAQLENSIAPELPANKPAETSAGAPEKKTKTTKRGVTRFESSAPTVEPVTLKEELNDDLPDFTK